MILDIDGTVANLDTPSGKSYDRNAPYAWAKDLSRIKDSSSRWQRFSLRVPVGEKAPGKKIGINSIPEFPGHANPGNHRFGNNAAQCRLSDPRRLRAADQLGRSGDREGNREVAGGEQRHL